MYKRYIKRALGIVLLVIGVGILLTSIALNLRQYYAKNKAIAEFEEYAESGEALTNSDDSEPEEGDLLYVLRIPSIDSKNPVREGTTSSVLADSLGHDSSTAYAGEQGNCVIAGHRNYTFGKFFNRLDEVQINDLIYVDTASATYTYVVTDIEVVDPDDVEILESEDGEEILTLYTCTPIYIATHRLVITAERIE